MSNINFQRNPYGNPYSASGFPITRSSGGGGEDFLVMYTQHCGGIPIGTEERKACLCQAKNKAVQSVQRQKGYIKAGASPDAAFARAAYSEGLAEDTYIVQSPGNVPQLSDNWKVRVNPHDTTREYQACISEGDSLGYSKDPWRWLAWRDQCYANYGVFESQQDLLYEKL